MRSHRSPLGGIAVCTAACSPAGSAAGAVSEGDAASAAGGPAAAGDAGPGAGTLAVAGDAGPGAGVPAAGETASGAAALVAGAGVGFAAAGVASGAEGAATLAPSLDAKNCAPEPAGPAAESAPQALPARHSATAHRFANRRRAILYGPRRAEINRISVQCMWPLTGAQHLGSG